MKEYKSNKYLILLLVIVASIIVCTNIYQNRPENQNSNFYLYIYIILVMVYIAFIVKISIQKLNFIDLNDDSNERIE